ncbi:hypothetical protein GCM10010185_53800 [Saccharothrix coeruleofusca]|uniref:Uncharacterized protein n=1 Tax=Saccharothrix coeruleofusca TaxID=33919 RepID=A0A918EGR2_9PSEU|nr:putative ester cyclase [Saccharothrix coeruleofusca]GGP73628.1 hypothetical protein GCM10010185_53800 [Saccharothrix coeruleofusca]
MDKSLGDNLVEARYRAYLDCLNERRFEGLARSCTTPSSTTIDGWR